MTDNARIFQEMRDAETLRQEMRQGVLDKFRDSLPGQALGRAFDSELAKGVIGGLRDAYRRVFEQGWHGKDVFDGRFHMDNQVGESLDMGGRYDQRASFYGWDNHRDNGVEAGERAIQDKERERGDALERGR